METERSWADLPKRTPFSSGVESAGPSTGLSAANTPVLRKGSAADVKSSALDAMMAHPFAEVRGHRLPSISSVLVSLGLN